MRISWKFCHERRWYIYNTNLYLMSDFVSSVHSFSSCGLLIFYYLSNPHCLFFVCSVSCYIALDIFLFCMRVIYVYKYWCLLVVTLLSVCLNKQETNLTDLRDVLCLSRDNTVFKLLRLWLSENLSNYHNSETALLFDMTVACRLLTNVIANAREYRYRQP